MTGKVLFNQQAVKDPSAIYREQAPVYYDQEDDVWAIYSHEGCKYILEHPAAIIPPVSMEGIDETLVAGLVRLSNPPAHAHNRAATYALFKKLQFPEVSSILDKILHPGELDWVATVSKRLPAMLLLKGLGYSDEPIVDLLPDLALLMLAKKTPEQVAAINSALAFVNDPALASLLIQSYDAGNGMLSNALLDQAPPIHHTRRIITADVIVHGQRIPKGATIILVLAAANLPFGAGIHHCIAEHFIKKITSDTMTYLHNRFTQINILETTITYAPLLNARIPTRLKIHLS